MGEQLAREAPVEADLVIGIPDSGTPAAIGFSKASGIPFNEALIKNRYVARTFIQPDRGCASKDPDEVQPARRGPGKRIVAVDDSSSVGTPCASSCSAPRRRRRRGACPHLSPPVVSPCFYGIDMADEDDAAAHRSVEEMRAHIGATSLHYLSVDGMQGRRRFRRLGLSRLLHARLSDERPAEGREAPL